MEQTLLGEGRKKICHGRGIPIQNIRKHSQRTYDPYPFGKSRPARIISPKKKERKMLNIPHPELDMQGKQLDERSRTFFSDLL
jgi:hypothetical protein